MKPKIGDYIRMKKVAFYSNGRKYYIGRIEKITTNKPNHVYYTGKYTYLIRFGSHGMYCNREDFDVVSSEEYMLEQL